MNKHQQKKISSIESHKVALAKKNLRSRILSKLKIQKEEDRSRKSSVIKKKLFKQSVFKKAKIVMFYMSVGGEVDTQEMIRESKAQGKLIAVPVCKKNRTIKPCILEDGVRFVRGPYGIWEPASKKCIRVDDIDLVIVPGLAFDSRGRRLGRGKGYYDRFLEHLPRKITSLGLAFDFQILPEVPTNTMDIDVSKVLFA